MSFKVARPLNDKYNVCKTYFSSQETKLSDRDEIKKTKPTNMFFYEKNLDVV